MISLKHHTICIELKNESYLHYSSCITSNGGMSFSMFICSLFVVFLADSISRIQMTWWHQMMMLVKCQSAEFCILPRLTMQMQVFLNRGTMSTIVLPASIAITQDSRQQGPFSGQAVMNVGYSLVYLSIPQCTWYYW